MKEHLNQARWIAVLAATGIALYLCWLMLRPFVGVLEWAAVLVIVFYPVHKWLAKKIKRRGLSALMSSLVVIFIVLLPLTFLTMALTNELSDAARNLPVQVNQLVGSQAPVPSPVLWAVLMTFVCMIPIAGSFLVWPPLSIHLMMTGHWSKAILLLLWGTLVISTIDNFLRPKLINNQTKLHELFVFFSVLGGISVFGLLGIVLGPVVLAITLGLLNTFSQDDRESAEGLDAARPSSQPGLLGRRTAA